MNVARTLKRPTRRDLVAFVVREEEQKEEPMEVVGLGGGRLEGSVRVGGAPALMVYCGLRYFVVASVVDFS